MKTPNKVGRPALSIEEKKGKFISTRLSPDEYNEIVQAAKESGMSKTKWVRTKLLAAARRTKSPMTETAQNQATRSVYEAYSPGWNVPD